MTRLYEILHFAMIQVPYVQTFLNSQINFNYVLQFHQPATQFYGE